MSADRANHRMAQSSGLPRDSTVDQSYISELNVRNQDENDEISKKFAEQMCQNNESFQPSTDPSDLEDTITANINRTLENTSFSIYGGSSNIWKNTSHHCRCNQFEEGSTMCRCCTFELTFLRSFRRGNKHFSSISYTTKPYNKPNTVLSTENMMLSERLIEEELKLVMDPSYRKEVPSNLQSEITGGNSLHEETLTSENNDGDPGE
ncbi:hypothetical protein BBOV_III002680 [Babesia bovis T2Bo]|uniref:Uncharacterized protein n=1 Tax=Babesia bovis TaxID=5865 RepID=A7AMP9_BABBO|nr:hypothetical protein BBOV_III002680 [Babesia bovis T2Bo]EDO07833.1 hypothetical protein BBOV_III002680 [Babesia bovis T2Bo]BAN65916.1 hypothetical protein [Babesia bovis]|eukprot:XP_001611401.1 hypothetical protein [Babesia bovis T2Bo]